MSKEYQYLVDRYAQSLTKYEVKTLFERLRERKGSVAAATKDAEISRKTVYDWEDNSDDVKMATKRKILQASLETDMSGTTDFLIKKTTLDHSEILERYINTNLNKILNIATKEEFQQNVSQFEKTLKSHIGALFDIKTLHIEEITEQINQKAHSLGTEEIPKDISLMSPQTLSQKLILLLEVFSMKTMFKNEIAARLGLPKEFVERASSAASYIDPPSEPHEILNPPSELYGIPGASVGMDYFKSQEVETELDRFRHVFARKE